jgi:hypothetical protein
MAVTARRFPNRYISRALLVLLSTSALASTSAVPAGGAAAGNPAPPRVRQAPRLEVPLAFEENRGQTSPAVRYVARTPGYQLFLTDREATVVFGSGGGRRAVALRPAGARVTRATGERELPGRAHYLVGPSSKWRRNVPTFGAVRYPGLYDGIDLVFYGSGREIEHDYVVAPHADPGVIEFEISGAEAVRPTPEGDLVIGDRIGGIDELRLRAPRVYQDVDGRRVTVASSYVVRPSGRVGIRLGAYDRGRTLVIDPVIAYSTYLGGSEAEIAFSIAVDDQGHAYVAGLADSLDFPVTPGALDSTGDGPYNEAFVAKLSPDGSRLIFATYLGGSKGEIAHGVDVDAAGNVYVAGTTMSGDFPVKRAVQWTFRGTDDAFLTKLDPSGSSIVYSTFLGGSDTDIALEVAVQRATGEAWVGGRAASSNFRTTTNAFRRTGAYDSFVARFTSLGALVYSTYVGASYGGVEDLAIDAQGNAYLTGSAMSLPVTPGAYQTVCDGCSLNRADAFVAKMNPEGTALVYATFLGGSALDRGLGITVDADGEAYVVGMTESTNGSTKPFPTTPGVFQPTGGVDAFVTKLNATGSALVYSSYLGGAGRDQAMSVAVDAAEAAYVTGSTQSSDFPLVAPTQATLAVYGSHDAFLTVVSPTGSSLLFSTFLGGYSRDEGHHVVLDAAGSAAYVTGQTSSFDFPTTAGAFQTQQRNQSTEAFVTKFQLEDPPPPPPPAASVTVVTPNSATNWGIGSTWQLKWQHTLGTGSYVRVELSRDGGATWSDIAPSVLNTSATAGSLNWVVTGPETAQALIRVSSVDTPSVADVSDNVFRIAAPSVRVTDPNTASIVWTTGTTATVRWSHNLGGKESVRIELSLDGGISYPIVLASSTPCDGSHPITVQSGWSTPAARVRVVWLRDLAVADASDVNFTIQ